MKQVLQDVKSGRILLEEVGAPAVRPGHLLIRTTRSLISSGTERSVVEFGRAGYIAKARQQPERVRQALDKVRTDGLKPTIEAVRSKLEQPVELGYCNVGRVVAIGEGVEGFTPGDRVASNGHHAELVVVPRNLCAKVPDEVGDDKAAFTVIGSIALHGIRLITPTLGESVAVVGLGLVGLVAIQILKAHGTRVIGFDTDPARLDLARKLGFEAVDASAAHPVRAGVTFSGGAGVDGVLITASTPSDEVIHQAAEMCRKRGRIVLTGVVGLDLRRQNFYQKELTFQVSCSYGPGRYDPLYEEEGRDYPIGYVRWTEQRNFEAVLHLLRDGRLRVDKLISERVPFAEAQRAYELVRSEPVIGVLLTYPDGAVSEARARTIEHLPPRKGVDQVVCGVIGAGDFAQRTLIPGLRKAGARLKWVASAGGVSAATGAKRFKIERSTTDVDAIFADPEVNCVVIATRHDTHADLTVRALEAGKSVYCEKPLCLNEEELERIVEAHEKAQAAGPNRPILMVGFNRRFAPLVQEMKKRLEGRREPLAMVYTVNAGYIPPDHWIQDPKVGGGRIVGEACHFIDLLRYLARSPIRNVTTLATGGFDDRAPADTVSIGLRFEDGSLGQVNYFANGSKRYPKESLEVYSEGKTLRMENFRRLRTYGFPGRVPRRGLSQPKGHAAEFARLISSLERGGHPPIPFEELLDSTRASLAAAAF